MRKSANVPFGIDVLRHAVRLFSQCRETFNQGFSPNELIMICMAHRECDWDILPDAWSDRQVREARLYGRVPNFKLDERGCHVPVYGRVPVSKEKRS